MGVDLEETDISPGQWPELFRDLQGNILKGHGRDHTIHLFMRFDTTKQAAARKWLASFGTTYVTSAAKQIRDSQRFKASSETERGDVFISVFLSAKGYTALGIPPENVPDDIRFIDGMKASRSILCDPPDTDWEEHYRNEIHAMILLADDADPQLPHPSLTRLDEAAKKITATVADFTATVFLQRGDAIRNERKETIEHFGYVDGRSQPLFLSEDIARERDNEGVTQWDPSAPLRLVLVREHRDDGAESYGSYFVFRKLEQNVRGFKEQEHKLAEALRLPKDEAERAGALVVGRFEDGTPVTLQYADGMHNPVPNNFTYDADTAGHRCPFQAHIRKINPRGRSGEGLDNERMHRIVRRGITYDDRSDKSEQHPTGQVGLLFMCFQADLANQFEYLQSQFANNVDFPSPRTGLDPSIGQSNSTANVPQEWPPKWGNGTVPKTSFDFSGFVTLKGGEYFFAPSISFLKNL
jgi:Dyp-type peroxidase family